MSLSTALDEPKPKPYKKHHKNIPKFPSEIFPSTVIDEEPELASSIDFSESNLDYIYKIKRFFSKGFLANSIITLFNQSPLLILLYYPYAFYHLGFIFGIVFLCLIILNSYFTSFLTLRIKQETSSQSYNEFIQKYLGENICLIYNCIYFIYCFSLAMIYIYTYSHIINELLHVLFDLGESSRVIRLIVLTVSLVLIGVPSYFYKKESVNNVIQIINVAVIVLCVVCVCMYNLITTSEYSNNINELAFIKRNKNISISLSMIMLSISIHPFLHKQMNDLKLFTMKRAKRMIVSTSLIQFVFYLLFGLFAFLTTKYNVNPTNNNNNFLLFFICNPNITSSHNVVLFYIIQLFKFLIALICVYNSSITINEFYNTIKTQNSLQSTTLNTSYELIKYQNENNTNLKENISKNNSIVLKLFCVLILIVINIIILFTDDDSIHLAFTFSGGLCAGIICYVFPCVGFLLVFKYEKHIFKCFVVVVMCTLGVISVGITVHQCVVVVNEMF